MEKLWRFQYVFRSQNVQIAGEELRYTKEQETRFTNLLLSPLQVLLRCLLVYIVSCIEMALFAL